MKRKKLILEPTVISAEDYHEFQYIQELFNLVFKKVEYEELDQEIFDGIYKARFYSK